MHNQAAYYKNFRWYMLSSDIQTLGEEPFME